MSPPRRAVRFSVVVLSRVSFVRRPKPVSHAFPPKPGARDPQCSFNKPAADILRTISSTFSVFLVFFSLGYVRRVEIRRDLFAAGLPPVRAIDAVDGTPGRVFDSSRTTGLAAESSRPAERTQGERQPISFWFFQCVFAQSPEHVPRPLPGGSYTHPKTFLE